jgi:hypothetical protein
MRSINTFQVCSGFVALFAGLLLYLIYRPPDTFFISFIKWSYNPSYWVPPFFTAIGGVLPSFLHVLAFSLIAGGLSGCRKTGYLIICCTWFITNLLFELGQRHPILASQVIPKWFEGVFILENMKNYFLRGTFDFFDLLASSAGAAAAYWVLVRTMEERGE